MDLDTILEKWEESKKQRSFYEKECEKYKEAVESYMNKKNKDIIKSKNFSVSRRINIRQNISKQNIPLDIWDKYSSRFSYTSYHLKKIQS